ncbi:MAG: GNAT family N-acetyltransferase [Nostoc sp. DedVER02]|uniref:GNAT family N-acetyltransferase n=1 Tax=unclassified Nostoc TaxID=2593658 RepID=UPI002AD29069|nr:MULTISPECIES: GNAT family N-acetyltransferase [unclassified Nostoc]MDZ7988983.1 GNAT family N-acetyltransferase [Nostoc sp. DedVER02]MDZ8114778.1 GNAT family N-acetyltransferase [Nostoc sp. DedVER01b]
MPILITLQPGDEVSLEEFLLQHTDTSMFLRSNWRAAGLLDEGARFQGTYVAAYLDESIVAVAAHFWNGMIIVQAPVYLPEVVQAVVAKSGRAISGISGPAAQVEATKSILGISNRPTQLDEPEILFSLALQDLQIPEALASAKLQCRLPHPGELELLSEWCVAYNVEALGKTDTPSLRLACDRIIEARQDMNMHWVLVAEDTLVSYSAFNASLPDIVQIGGVWTPPALRGKGYAKNVVAGSLLDARSQGVKRAILFTGHNNQAAQAVYRGIGFLPTGKKYGLVLFEETQA